MSVYNKSLKKQCNKENYTTKISLIKIMTDNIYSNTTTSDSPDNSTDASASPTSFYSTLEASSTILKRKGRITILLGAGCIMDINNAQSASTSAITKLITDQSSYEDETSKAFANALNNYKIKFDLDRKKCNFEDLYYAATLLGHYIDSNGDRILKSLFELKKTVENENESTNNDDVIETSSTNYIDPQDSVIASLKKLSADKTDNLTYKKNIVDMQPIPLASFILKQISTSVSQYCIGEDEDLSNNSSLKYYYTFFKKMDEWSEGGCDIYTLCYDNLVEKSLQGNYVDGFVKHDNQDRSIFNPIESLENRSTNIVNHLHGSIYYSLNIDSNGMGEWSRVFDYAKTVNNCPGAFLIEGCAKESFILSPIITGLNKTENLISEPFRSYYSNFNNSVLNNDITIIIGYSFSDVHINQVLYTARRIKPENNIIIISPDKTAVSPQFEYLSRDCGEYEREKIEKNGKIWYTVGFKKAVEETDLMTVLKSLIKSRINP